MGGEMSRLKEILDRRESRRSQLAAHLELIVAQLAELGAVTVILFGSLADGSVDVDSDLDLLAVMPDDLTGKEWMNRIYGAVDRGVACDILAYNKEEFRESLASNTFVANVVEKGKVVYEKTDERRMSEVAHPGPG